MPSYEIIEWNEDNFDINYNDFTRQSYEQKKYAFTSDVIRLYALYTEGGIYMDTDVEVYAPLDEFLSAWGSICGCVPLGSSAVPFGWPSPGS